MNESNEKFLIPEVGMTINSVPMRGYITKDEKDRLWIQDREGTWIVGKNDIAITEEWKGADPRFKGKPVCIYIREGADIYEIKRFKVQISSRPITLNDPQAPIKVEGDDLMNALESKWIRHLGFKPQESSGPLSMRRRGGRTICCYADVNGATCEVDDCGYGDSWC